MSAASVRRHPGLRGASRATAALLAVAAGPALAAEWSIESSITARALRDTNIALTSEPHDSVTGLSLAPVVRAGYESEVTTLAASLGVNVRRYPDAHELDATDVLVDLNGHHKGELDTLGGTLNYTRDTTLASELLQTGQAISRRQRESFAAAPDWTRRLSERTDVGAGYRFNDVRYQDATDSGLVDYRYQQAYGTLRYALGVRDDVTGAIGYARYDPTDGSRRVDVASLRADYQRQLTETMRLFASAGWSRLHGPGLDGGSADRALGAVRLQRDFETGALAVQASRELQPSGSGALATVDRAAADWDGRLAETVAWRLGAAVYRTRFVGDRANSENSRYWQVESRLVWTVQPDWFIEGGYRYQHLQYDNTAGSANGHLVELALRHAFPRIDGRR